LSKTATRRNAVYKAIGIWSWPRDEDRAQFDEHYEKVHYPLAEKLPGAPHHGSDRR
jgi:hypothetical protein